MNSRPFSLLKTAFDPLFPLGTLVMYEQDGSPDLAVITGNRKERYLAHASNGKEIELTKNRLHRVPGAIPATAKTIDEKIAFLKDLLVIAEEKAVSTETLWNTFSDSPEKILSETEITEKQFGSVETAPYISVRFALLKDRVYFKREQNGFSPRPANTIEQLKRDEAQRIAKRSLYIETARFLRNKSKDKHLEIPSHLLPSIRILESCAATAHNPNATFHSDAEDLVLLCERELHIEPQGRLEHRAFHILYKAGHFKKDTNISVIRHQARIDFPEACHSEAGALLIPEELDQYSDHSIRKDLTALHSFTIDDEATHDMDDALSIEEADCGYRLYVHISDVAYAIRPGTALDTEAITRATSVYCPDITINMLPDVLCHDKLSLVVGKVRPCFTCIFDINHSFEVLNADITPSIIKVSKRYSYTDVDELLYKEDRLLTWINNVAAAMEQKRILQGATRITKRDAQPVLIGNEITLVEIDEQSPARNLVGEMMVLANTIMANFLYSNKLPALYRSQEAPDPSALQEVEAVPAGPAREYAERVRLKRSIVSLVPGFHATLGLNAYIQCTSPIRRYVDLILQRQMHGFFRSGEVTYTGEDLLAIQEKVDEPLHKAMAISKETKRYWILRYLEKKYLNLKKITGTVVRIDTKMPMVELDEVFIVAGARIYGASLGQKVTLNVQVVDPRGDYVRLDEVKKPPNSRSS